LPSISLTTVYRNLNSLADDNQILRISSSAGNSDRYDRTIVQHAHVMCERCGAFFDFFDAPSCDSSIQRLSDDYDFLVTRCGTIFVGVCAKCKNEQKNESSIL
ncbi:MAG: transcriptional repressor, partial [Clostridia bacterium]